MVQVLPARQKNPSFSQALFGGLAQGALEEVPKYFQGQADKARQEKENSYLEQLMPGSSALNPELRKVALAEELKGRRKKEEMTENNNFLSKIFGGESSDDSEQTPTKYSPESISDEDIAQLSMRDPNLGKEVRSAKDAAIKKKEREAQVNREERQFFHKESGKYYDTLQDSATQALAKNRAIDRQLKDVDKIGWWDRAVSSLAANTPYGDLLRSSTAQQFDANTLAQLQGQRELLGGILSDSDIRLLMQKIVTASKDPEANKVIAKNMKLENDLTIAKSKIANEIQNENKGYRPANFRDEVEKRYLEKYGNKIQESFNEIMSLPDDPKKFSQIYRKQVHPNTPLNEEIIENYLKITNRDAKKATQMAREDGYFVPE